MFKKRFTLCFLLIFSLLLSPTLSAAVPEADAFGASNTQINYLELMDEPRVEVGGVRSAGLLSREELKSLKLYPGGVPFGVKFLTEGILIVGFSDIGGSASKNPSSAAGLKVGDRIISVNGQTLTTAAQLNEIAANSGGKALSVLYTRHGEKKNTTLIPVYSNDEKCYKTGLYVKDNGAGIGTVTYIVPESLSFGGLGHGICEADSGRLTPISRGSVLDVTINGVVRGQSGAPGEVKGYFSSSKTGSLLKNTDCGVFGVFASLPKNLPCEPLSLGLRDEVHNGRAYIYSTLDENGPKKYEIEISAIARDETGGKCFSVKITDPALIQKTGGIIQGMSGSPIIQDGKLIGALTHVLISTPTEGYGIFIENMLSQMN